VTSVHYSSRTDEWETPLALFNALSDEFGGFDLDVCATPENAKCSKYFTKVEDGLAQEWHGKCWMNPPYGRAIGSWMRKAHESGAFVVCLVPARTDTAWWHEYAMRGEIRFLRGRVRFGGGKHCAPFPSAIVIFGKNKP